MGIERGAFEKNPHDMPDLFDAGFQLPDTPFAAFHFKNMDADDVRSIGERFADEHTGEMVVWSNDEPKIFTSRRGEHDTARLMLEFIRTLADEGDIPKGGVEVSGLNKMPE